MRGNPAYSQKFICFFFFPFLSPLTIIQLGSLGSAVSFHIGVWDLTAENALWHIWIPQYVSGGCSIILLLLNTIILVIISHFSKYILHRSCYTVIL